ncbi:hypothetical protein [Bradyrhizobium iriomotense]|uniref:hypothetical protein n=1 Tax=Bradyrhizobium iriomotense TaxID=441950 RepID=UPI001B89EF82|nr:hypothetical protein [Bradyrhizobium iriomotense]MBR0784819.1 hypothetical protein [Bradyrhizobium iriomotense]
MLCNTVSRASRIGAVLAWAIGTTITVAGAAELTFDFHIERGRVAESTQVIRIKQGDVVKLRWHTDRSMILHLHGYDIEKKVEPDTFGLMEFTAYATGRFPVEIHGSPGPGGHSHGGNPLVRVEVYP